MIKTNIKMRVTPEQSAKVQEICFENGIYWMKKNDRAIQYTGEPFLVIDGYIFYMEEKDDEPFLKEENEEVDADLFIRTNGTCIEKRETKMKYNEKLEILKEWEDTAVNQEFKYPMWFKSKKWDYIVKFTDLRQGIVVAEGTNPRIDKDFSCSIWTAHTDSEIWEQVENPDLATDINNNKAKNPNSKHYELWENFEAIDVIKLALTDEEYKGFLKGNILKYRLRVGKKDDVSKEIEKIKDYERELNK